MKAVCSINTKYGASGGFQPIYCVCVCIITCTTKLTTTRVITLDTHSFPNTRVSEVRTGRGHCFNWLHTPQSSCQHHPSPLVSPDLAGAVSRGPMLRITAPILPPSPPPLHPSSRPSNSSGCAPALHPSLAMSCSWTGDKQLILSLPYTAHIQ